MASCPKCGKRIKRKRESDGIRACRRHGPIENQYYDKIKEIASRIVT